MSKLPFFIDAILGLPAILYNFATRARNAAYDSGVCAVHSIGRPVVSVGNLTAGGTGKTPITSFLVSVLREKGMRVGVISRGYGGRSSGTEKVSSGGTPEEARLFGDEPSWLANQFPEVPVYVGVDKVATARALVARENVELIIADDAFQHRRLHRDVDIVILDASEPEWHCHLLPRGRLREAFSGLRRSHVVFITKTNLVAREVVERLRARAKEWVSEDQILEFETSIEGFVALEDNRAHPPRRPSPLGASRVLLASGIGRPHTFLELVRRATGAEIVDHLIFKDHHFFTKRDQQLIEQRARDRGASVILVTEKDAVKLADWKPQLPVFVSRLAAHPRVDLETFYSFFGSKVLDPLSERMSELLPKSLEQSSLEQSSLEKCSADSGPEQVAERPFDERS